MAHKIGVVTKNSAFFKRLDTLRRGSPDFEMELVKSIDGLNQLENTGKKLSSFIFDSTQTVDDIINIGKYIKTSKRYDGSLIFLAFEDFETFQKITIDDTFKNATIINMPTPSEDIYKRITSDTAQVGKKETTPPVQKENKGNNSAAFLNLFIEATTDTIKEMAMCSEDILHSQPALLDYTKLEAEPAIRGKLAINSPYFIGSFFISFPETTFLKMSSKILYEEVKEINKDNEDLVSEICNIVYGKSKVLAGKFNMNLGMVIPTYNRDPKIVHNANIIVVKFKSELGEFYIKVAPGMP